MKIWVVNHKIILMSQFALQELQRSTDASFAGQQETYLNVEIQKNYCFLLKDVLPVYILTEQYHELTKARLLYKTFGYTKNGSF